MLNYLLCCVLKPKVKPLTELDLIKNKIRIHNESLTIITNSFKDKSTKLNTKTY